MMMGKKAVCNAIERMIAEKVRLTASDLVHPEMFSDAKVFAQRAAHLVDALTVSLDAYVAGMPEETIDIEKEWPADWWQAFRERWFPSWWLRRYPVRYERLSVHRTIYRKVCPHVRVPDQGTHLEWLAQKEL